MNGNPCFIYQNSNTDQRLAEKKSFVNDCFWSGSDAVLHMSRIEFNNLSSCEVQCLNQFRTDWLSRFSHLAQLGITAVDQL